MKWNIFKKPKDNIDNVLTFSISYKIIKGIKYNLIGIINTPSFDHFTATKVNMA